MTLFDDFLAFVAKREFSCIVANPPWLVSGKTGRAELRDYSCLHYPGVRLEDLLQLPVFTAAAANAHLYLWAPSWLLAEGLQVMERWGFQYKTALLWEKVRQDGGIDGSSPGYYFRPASEILLFGVRGTLRTLPPARRQTNVLRAMNLAHNRKPEAAYDLVERCSPGPYLELFAADERKNWSCWCNLADDSVEKFPRQLRRQLRLGL
jgi:N6-adenosine-specific RNA methylase IME4